MAAAPVPLAVAATLMQTYGMVTANQAQAKAEKANRDMYLMQKAQAQMSARREADIYSGESKMVIGSAVSLLDRAGVDMTGSALMKIANMQEQAGREYRAILIGSSINSSILAMRAAQANRESDLLSSGGYNAMQGAGIALNGASTIAQISAQNKNNSPGGHSYTGLE